MADIPVVRSYPGLVVSSGSGYVLNVNGSDVADVLWPAGYIPTVGDAVRVLVVNGEMSVLGPVATGPRPFMGTVSGAASGGFVPVDTVSGTIEARYTGTAPSLGTAVFLDWQATTPRVLPGAAATSSAPTPDPTPPPRPPTQQSGTLTVTATGSGSWQVGGDWAYQGTSVIQYRYGGARENRGAWFYGSRPTQLRGRTVTALRIRLGARLRVGSYNSALPLHVYLTANANRPGGDVNRISGPADITLAPNAGAGWHSLPTSFGQALVDNGGGIGVTGSPYMGVNGVGADPASGQLQLDWTR